MYLENPTEIHFYNSCRRDLYITEFGHSRRRSDKIVGPWIRDVYLLHIVIKGVCHFCDFEVEPGEVFLISKGNVHSFFVEQGYEHFWIGFDGTKAATLAALFDLNLNQHQRMKLLKTSLNLPVLYRDLFEHGQEPDSERAVISLLMQTLALVDNVSSSFLSGSYVSRACNFMDHNYHRKISMNEVANHVNISEKHMCRLFKQELQITPMQYLQTVRMEHAKQLLQGTDMRIRDIAYTVGYPSQLSFSAAFSSYEACSPTEFRETNCTPDSFVFND